MMLYVHTYYCRYIKFENVGTQLTWNSLKRKSFAKKMGANFIFFIFFCCFFYVAFSCYYSYNIKQLNLKIYGLFYYIFLLFNVCLKGILTHSELKRTKTATKKKAKMKTNVSKKICEYKNKYLHLCAANWFFFSFSFSFLFFLSAYYPYKFNLITHSAKKKVRRESVTQKFCNKLNWKSNFCSIFSGEWIQWWEFEFHQMNVVVSYQVCAVYK